MTITFNSVETIEGSGGASFAKLNLSGTGSVGDLQVAWVTVNAASKTIKTNWNAGATYTDANGTSAWAWCFFPTAGVSDLSPLFYWDGTTQAYHAQGQAFTGANYNAIGANNSAHGTTSPSTIASQTTQQANSIILAVETTLGNNQVIPLPSPYINIAQYNDAAGSNRTSYETVAAAGGNSDAISSTITSAIWHTYGIELCGAGSSWSGPTLTAGSVKVGSPTASNLTVSSSQIPGNVGDVVVAYLQVDSAAQTISISGSGWSIYSQDNTGNITVAIATCINTGATASVTFSWSATTVAQTQLIAYSNVKTSAPIAQISYAHATSGTVAISGITTLNNKSLVLLYIAAATVGNPGSAPIAQSDYQVTQAYVDTNVANTMANARIPNAGSASVNYSQAFTDGGSRDWKALLMELVTAPSTAPSAIVPVAIRDASVSRSFLIGDHRAFIKAQ